MGVSGSGKSTVGQHLVDLLGWPFAEGDDFHPAANVEKMRSGRPLSDRDRRPWLAAVADWIGEHEAAGRSAVVTCSALKRAYREALRRNHPSVWFVHVSASPERAEGPPRDPQRSLHAGLPAGQPARDPPAAGPRRAGRHDQRRGPARRGRGPGRSTPCVTSADGDSATPAKPSSSTGRCPSGGGTSI